MITKQVSVVRVQNMADGGIRVVLDLINGNGSDMKEIYDMRTTETTMVLAPTQAFHDAQDEETH